VAASALGSLRGQPSCGFPCALELLEQLERGGWYDDHKFSVWIVCVDLGYRIQHFLALGSLVSNQEITSHWCERALAWLPVKSKLLRINPVGEAAFKRPTGDGSSIVSRLM
jgi:hypothetical protein